jgi:hypothetical protein
MQLATRKQQQQQQQQQLLQQEQESAAAGGATAGPDDTAAQASSSAEITPRSPQSIQEPIIEQPSSEQPVTTKHLLRQAFISHSGQDKDARVFACSVLAPALQTANMPVYIDFQDLEPGGKWPVALMNAAANSQVVVAVLSRSCVRRFWCMLELDLALHWRKDCSMQPLVIPVFVEPPGQEMEAAAVQWFWEQALLSPEQANQQQQQQQISAELQEQLGKLQQLPPERKLLIQPERWASNIENMRKLVQNLRLQNFSGKDAEARLAAAVVQRVVSEMLVQAVLPEGLFGMEEQQEELLQELQIDGKLGLWLYAVGA